MPARPMRDRMGGKEKVGIREAADILRVHRTTLRDWIRKGLIECGHGQHEFCEDVQTYEFDEKQMEKARRVMLMRRKGERAKRETLCGNREVRAQVREELSSREDGTVRQRLSKVRELEEAGFAKLDPEELADYEAFIEKHMQVRDESGQIVPFMLRETQRRYVKMRQRLREAGNQVRIVHLKPRQEGSSTIRGACLAVDLLRFPGSRAAVISNEVKVSHHIARDFVYEQLVMLQPKFGFQLTKYTEDTKKPAFVINPDEPKLRTECWILTANSDDKTGRSFTYQFLLASEVAYWARGTKNQDAEQSDRVFTSFLQSFPDPWVAPHVAMDVESTARGAFGAFYDLCQEAQDPEKNVHGWTFDFSPWFETEKYKYPGAWEKENALLAKYRDGFADEDAVALGMDKDECELVKAYPQIEWGHLKWRREIGIPVKCKGKKAQFRQEYPANPIEAFVESGNPIFESTSIEAFLKETVRDGEPFMIVPVSDKAWRLEPYIGFDPALRVWAQPEKGRHYTIGSDVSLGVGGMSGASNEKSDFSVASVWCNETLEQVAEWVGKPHPEDLGDVLFQLGMMYNVAAINVEKNAWGETTLMKLRRYRYPGIYMYVPQDARGAWLEPVIGTPVTKNTRAMLLDSLRYAVQNKVLVPRSRELIQEMRTFVALNGRFDHIKSAHDDRVFAAAHAWWVLADRSPIFAGEVDMKTDREEAMELFGMASTAWEPGQPLRIGQRRGVSDPVMAPWGFGE